MSDPMQNDGSSKVAFALAAGLALLLVAELFYAFVTIESTERLIKRSAEGSASVRMAALYRLATRDDGTALTQEVVEAATEDGNLEVTLFVAWLVRDRPGFEGFRREILRRIDDAELRQRMQFLSRREKRLADLPQILTAHEQVVSTRQPR